MLKTWWHRFKERERAWRNNMGVDISTPESRARAWRHYLWIDHGILRLWWTNFHEVGEGVYRANQPDPARLKAWKKRGIRTILNLRGIGEHSPYHFEVEACEKLGLTMIDHRLYAQDLASRDELLGLIEHFRTLQKPVVMHCKSGSDRAGFAAALFLHIIDKVPIEEAWKQLHWKHFHLKNSKNGILDLFFVAYLEDCKTDPIPLEKWISTVYDPESLRARFQKTGWRPI